MHRRRPGHRARTRDDQLTFRSRRSAADCPSPSSSLAANIHEIMSLRPALIGSSPQPALQKGRRLRRRLPRRPTSKAFSTLLSLFASAIGCFHTAFENRRTYDGSLGRLASASRRDGTISNADRHSMRCWSHRPQLRIYAGPASSLVRALDVACHFQTTQQLDIARETADCRLGRAGLPVHISILRPRLLELPKCGSFVARAAGHIDARSTLKTALPHDVKLRHRVRDGNRRKGHQDCDRQMKLRVDLLASCFWKGRSAQHLSGTPTVGLGGRTGAQQAQLYLAAIDERDWRIEDHTLASSQSGVYFHPRA
ncbi:hypothetical protein SAMN05443247_09753 [Bradyrhizobium erythrophlei]|nr:hypothetical protein SAMN05443247_09753 [Bradyrhizobium erythrophlei]